MIFKNLSAINRRRLNLFKANKRGFWSFILFTLLFVFSVFAPLIANDKPILASYKGDLLYPLWRDYPEEMFGGFLAKTDFRDMANQDEISANGWMIWATSEVLQKLPAGHKDYQLINDLLSLQRSKTILMNNYGLQTDLENREAVQVAEYGSRLDEMRRQFESCRQPENETLEEKVWLQSQRRGNREKQATH